MDNVVTVVIGILGVVLLVAAISLTVLVVKYRCKKKDLITEQHRENSLDSQLIVESSDSNNALSPVQVELGAFQISSPKLEEYLNDTERLDDTYGLIPHCLAILKICHYLTDNLVRIGCSYHCRSSDRLMQMVTVARQIGPKVDDVLDAIHPPLDPKKVESRFTALVLTVSQLAMITKNICSMSGQVDWIDQSLQKVEDHLKVLRDAKAATEEHDQGMPPSSLVHSGVAQVPSFGTRNDVSQL